jgi:AraC-like DNA-binding protein
LIRKTSRNLIEIGLEVGYTSPSHFAQVSAGKPAFPPVITEALKKGIEEKFCEFTAGAAAILRRHNSGSLPRQKINPELQLTICPQ